MDRHNRAATPWNKSKRLLPRFVSGVVALALLGGLAAAPASSTSDAYLQRQAAALQPMYYGDLEALTDVPRYLIEADIDPEAGEVAGQMRLDFTNTSGESLTGLAFRLYPNAKSIYGGGSLNVEQVTEGRVALGSELSRDGTVLWVPLGRRLTPGEKVSLELTFSARVPARTSQGYGIYNRALGVLCLAGWYPILAPLDGHGGWDTPPLPATGDAMLAETSLYEVWLRLAEGYQVASTGSQLGQEQAGDRLTWHLVSGPAREFAVAVSDRFQILEIQAGGARLRLFTLEAEEPAVAPADGLALLAETMATYVERFGPYPFVEFDLVEAVVPIDGYEFSGMAYVDYAKRVREGREAYEYTLAHEVAHQWWYGLVGNDSVREPWLDEALATYAALIALEESRGSSARDRLVADWQGSAAGRGPGEPPVNSSTLAFSSWAPYHAAAYTRGALFLDELREALGDQRFFELLGRYQASYRYRMATTGDFLNLAEVVAGRDLDRLFADWFDMDAVRAAEGSNVAPGSNGLEPHAFFAERAFPARKGGAAR